MTRFNGYFSGGRAIPEKRIPAGKTDPSARREKGCCDVFVIIAARSTTKRSPGFSHSPNSTLSGSCLNELCKTSTFTGRLRTTGE